MGRQRDENDDRVPMRTKVSTEEYDQIYHYCRAHGLKSGQFLREAALQVLRDKGLASLRRMRLGVISESAPPGLSTIQSEEKDEC